MKSSPVRSSLTQSALRTFSTKRASLFKVLAIPAILGLGLGLASAASVTWTGATDNNWDTTTNNWSGFFTNGDDATFDLASGGTISLIDVIAPASTTVSAASGTFTFQGAAITSGTLDKSGAGTLVLGSANTYTGATTISGGTLKIADPVIALPVISGMVVHLDATTIVAANGDNVTTWTNLVDVGSGGAGDFNVSAGVAPIYVSAGNLMNGLPVVHFNNSAVLTNATPFGNDVTVIYVGRMTGGSNRRLVSAFNNWLLGFWGGNMNTHYWNNSPSNLSGALDYGSHIFVGTANGSTAWSYNADGNETLIGTGALGNGPNGLALGGWGTGPAEQSYGDVGELLVFNRALTAGERTQVERYLQAKWYGALPSKSAVNLTTSGATLDVDGANQTIGSLAGVVGSQVLVNGGDLTVGNNNTTTTFSGVLADGSAPGGTMLKTGNGDLILAGDATNTFTGTTTLMSGRIGLAKTGGAYALSGPLVLANAASPDIYTTVDDQFQPGYVMEFTGNVGDHVRFELLGTTQTVAGIDNADAGIRGVIQHREQVPAPAISAVSNLILNGTATDYFFGGYLRSTGGTLTLTKNGTGTQTLSGSSITYTGQTTVNDGTLVFSKTNALATSIENNAIVEINSVAGDDWNLGTRTLSGAGTWNKTGAGRASFNNCTVNASGQINILEGTLRNNFNASDWAGCTATANISSGAILDLYADPIYLDKLTGSGFVQSGYGNPTVHSGASPFIEKFVVGGVDASSTFSGTIRDNSGSTVPAAGAAGGGLELHKTGTGIFTLTGTNTYTGVTNVNEGTLLLDFDAGGTSDILSPSSALSLGGGTLEILGGSGEVNTQTFNGVTPVTASTLKLTPNGATSLDANLGALANGGAVDFVGANTTLSGGVAVPGTANFTTTTVAGADDGLTRLGVHLWNSSNWASTASDGSGTSYIVEWAGVYTDIYNGTDSGSVAIPTGVPGAEVRILESTTNVENTLGADETINSLLMAAAGNPAMLNMMGNTLTVGNGASANGVISIGSGAESLTIGTSVNDGNLTAGATDPSFLSLFNENAASAFIVNSAIVDNAGPAAVSIFSGGAAGSTVTLNGTNTYTGTTTIASDTTLLIGGAGTLGTGSITNNGTLQYSSSADQTFTGLTGSGALVKDTDAASTLTLSGGGISHTGATSIQSGTFVMNATTNYRSPTTVESGAVFVFGGTSSAEHNPWTGNALTLNDGATLNKTNTGYDTMNTGNLVINGTVAINITNNGASNQLFVGGNATPTGLTGSGTINLTNTGTATTGMTLRYSSSQPHFDGTLNVNGGVVNVGTGAGGLTLDNADLNLTGAQFNIGATAFAVTAAPGAVKSLSGDAASTTTLGAQILTVGTNDGSGDFAGVISGVGGGLTKVGSGTQLLSGANTYTGPTLVNDGVLGGNGSVDSAVTVDNGGTLAPGGASIVDDFTVNNNVTMVAGATLAIEIDGATADLLEISGDLNIDGATIDFSELSTPTGAGYVIASATSVIGTPVPTNVPTGYEVSVGATDIFLVPSIYGTWATSKGLTGANNAFAGDPESDSLVNLLEFAFGTDPLNSSDNLPLTVTDGTTFTPGTPAISMVPPFTPTNISARFVRRIDHVAAGLTYIPEFSADLSNWYTDPDNPVPVVISTDGVDYEVVEVPYLVFVNGGEKARFFRIRVNSTESDPVVP